MGQFGRDLLAGSIAVGAVIAITILAGQVFIPEPPGPAISSSTTTTVPSAAADPVAEIAALPAPAAVIYASGAVEGRFLLDGITPRFEWGPRGDGSSKDIRVQYRGSGNQLTLEASGIAIAEPRTEGVTAVLALEGRTFFAHDGECVLVVSRFEWLQPTDGTSRLVPTFAGEMTCTVTEVRSGESLSYAVAFDR